ncbi:MAG: PilZ domain-containing protein [Planctomycetota bacterium]
MSTQSPRPDRESGTLAPAEKRTRDRIRATGRVRVRLVECELEGPSVDISRQGLAFLTGDSPSLLLTVDVRGERRHVRGKLVRLESAGEQLVEWGVRLDEPLPGFE